MPTLAEIMRADVSDVFLDTGEHAESVTYQARGATATSTIKAVIERLSEDTITDDRGTRVQAMAFFHIADTLRPAEGDKFTVGGVEYRVDNIATDDGFGMLRVAAVQVTPKTGTVNTMRRTI